MKHIRQKGSITLEAAIVLPIFICIIVSILSVIKVIYTMDTVSYAINETAEQIASVVYPAHALGYRTETGFGTGETRGSEGIGDGIEGIISCLQLLSGSPESQSGGEGGSDVSRDIAEVLSQYLTDLLRNGLQDMAEEAFLRLMIDLCLPQYIEDSEPAGPEFTDADERLRHLGINNGYAGLDFRESNIFNDGSEDIEITVVYKINLPMPIRIFSPVEIRQTAVSRAWLGGDEPSPPEVEDIWSLDNLSRGKRVRELFGGNLPFSFPGLSAYKNGKATLIRSMDITAASYQNADNVEHVLSGYIDDIADYYGQPMPWGSDRIVIMPESISNRELIFVIPENPVSEGIQNALQLCRSYASERSVTLRIIKYGTKKEPPLIESEPNN